jgi:hypothetical protein
MLVALIVRTGSGQQLDTQELLDVVKKWNFANNAGSEATFRELYADNVFYYAEALTKNQCIAAKKDLLKSNPSYKQKIVTDPTFVAQTGGLIKSQFTKEVFERGRWRKVPTYLLISYENSRYVISGESDFETDKKRKRKPDIGTPMEIPAAKAQESIAEKSEADDAEIIDTTVQDSAVVSAVPDTVQQDALVTDAEDSTLLTSVSDEVLSDETVAVPKKYVYFLIGFLVLIALIVLFSKRKKRIGVKLTATPAAPREPVQVKTDKNFDSFVIALFDPHYFTVSTVRRKRVIAGNVPGQDFTPSLELDFQSKDSKVRLAIECIFVRKLTQEILSFSSAQINRYHDFEETYAMETYLVIGIEGEPGDPREIYLIPTADLREGHIRYPDLQSYRKHGMFFYNAVRRRLL